MARLGIDVGTWSIAAVLVEAATGRRRVVPDPSTGQQWSRSCVARGPGGGWLVGEGAEQIRPLRSDLYRDDLKRLLDSDEPVYLDGAPFTVEELLAELIRRRAVQAATMSGEPIDELVLGVPTSFEGTKEAALMQAALLAGFVAERVRLVPEPVAAARAALGELRATGTYLVFDLGGGTFDATLVEAQSGLVRVLDSVGDSEIGGFLIDAAIVDDLRSRHALPEATSDEAGRLSESDLLAAARTMKHRLSQDVVAYARNPYPRPERSLSLTRHDLARLAEPVTDAAVADGRRLLKDNGLDWSDLDAVVATGAATRSPVILDRIRTVTQAKLIMPPQQPELVTAFGLVPRGSRAAITGTRLSAIRSLHTLSGPASAIHAVAFSPDGTLVAGGCADHSVRIWNTATGNPYGRTLAGSAGHTGPVHALTFNFDGSVLVSGAQDGTIRLWDVASMSLRRTLSRHTGAVRAVQYLGDEDSEVLGSLGEDQKILSWDLDSGGVEDDFEDLHFNATCMAHNGHAFVVGGGISQGHRGLGQASDGRLQVGLDPDEFSDYDEDVRLGASSLLLSVALPTKGTTVATGGHNGEIRTWDLTAKADTAIVLTGHRDPVSSLAFSPDGSLLASSAESLRIWQPSTRISRSLDEHTANVTDVCFSADGSLLATSSVDNTIRIWCLD